MRKFILSIIFLSVLFVISACNHEEPDSPGETEENSIQNSGTGGNVNNSGNSGSTDDSNINEPGSPNEEVYTPVKLEWVIDSAVERSNGDEFPHAIKYDSVGRVVRKESWVWYFNEWIQPVYEYTYSANQISVHYVELYWNLDRTEYRELNDMMLTYTFNDDGLIVSDSSKNQYQYDSSKRLVKTYVKSSYSDVYFNWSSYLLQNYRNNNTKPFEVNYSKSTNINDSCVKFLNAGILSRKIAANPLLMVNDYYGVISKNLIRYFSSGSSAWEMFSYSDVDENGCPGKVVVRREADGSEIEYELHWKHL